MLASLLAEKGNPMGWATKAIDARRKALQSAYIHAISPKGIKCPHCGERIMCFVKNAKTGKIDACPACGKQIRKDG